MTCSLDAESAAVLVHTSVTSCVDYSNAMPAGASKSTTDKLQRVLNAAARVVSDTQKYDRGLTHLLHDELHCLDIPQPMHVQAVCNGLLMSAAQSTTVHDRLLHPYVRHCSSPASAVRRLPSAVRTATAAFDVRSSCFFCSQPSGLELVTRLPARCITFL